MELARNLRIDSVSRLEPTAPRHIEADKSVAAAVEMMRHERVGCLLVCRDGRLVGVFTERDLIVRVLAVGKPLSAPIAEVMTAKPITVCPKEPIRSAIQKMQDGGYRH